MLVLLMIGLSHFGLRIPELGGIEATSTNFNQIYDNTILEMQSLLTSSARNKIGMFMLNVVYIQT
jgi:hypothetical protein